MEKALHWCVDFQAGYPQQRPHLAACWRALEGVLPSAIEKFERASVLSVHVAYGSFMRFTPFPEGVGAFGLTPEPTRQVLAAHPCLNFALPLSPQDLVAYKNGYSVLGEKALAAHTRKAGCRKVILSGAFECGQDGADDGGLMSACVSRSAADFRRAGYEVAILAEATERGVISSPRFLPLETRNAIHNPRGVAVMPLEKILDWLEEPPAPLPIEKDRIFLRKLGSLFAQAFGAP